MTDQRTVLIANLNKDDIELSISEAIARFCELYGDPWRVWVNAKDIPDTIIEVNGYQIERRGGCARGKVMVM